MNRIAALIVVAILGFAACNGVGDQLGKSIDEEELFLDKSAVTVPVNGHAQLNVTIAHSTVPDRTIRWSTSDPDVAYVNDSGLITGMSAGRTRITASADATDITPVSCDVTVTAVPMFTESLTGDISRFALPSGVSFKMIRTPDIAATSEFPYGYLERRVRVPDTFVIAETETTYELWKEVYDWATDPVRGSKKYSFENPGEKGGYGGSRCVLTDKHPVTSVNWRDAIVWCNALTEYYNAMNGDAEDFNCVYTYNGSIIRDARNGNGIACDKAVQNPSSNGFRLPCQWEWEFAARYIGTSVPSHTHYLLVDGVYYTTGDCASGASDTTSNYDATHEVAAALDYHITTTSEVKSRKPNALGLYDMSGNVWEWCFDLSIFLQDGATHILCGGSFREYDCYDLELTRSWEDFTFISSLIYGFRITRNGN
ncbi:MAG TPA: SUMF1/EgtB/PvdO family nonheme iron enzyme [Spirochaetota bacterium]